METIVPVMRWLTNWEFETKFSKNDVLIVSSRSGRDYFVCPECNTKNYFIRNKVVEMICPKCNMFGVINTEKFFMEKFGYLYK